MGYDVSYHPMSEDEMNRLYFSQLKLLRQTGKCEVSKIFSEIKFKGCEEYKDDVEQWYLNTLSLALDIDENDTFEKSHVFYMAVVQGFFYPYFYTRGTAFSFLAEKYPFMKKYIDSWENIKPKEIVNKVSDKIEENYSGGCYISYNNVVKLLKDYENDEMVKNAIDEFYAQSTITFLKALNYAKDHKQGLFESTEVIEPNPMNLNETECYSNILNCDLEGVLIYKKTVESQLDEIIKSQDLPKDSIPTVDSVKLYVTDDINKFK